MPDRWPLQIKAFDETTQAIDDGERGLCVASPTGTGKTQMAHDLIEWAQRRNWPCTLYTNRKMLLEQTKRVLERAGIEVGMRASGHKTATLRDVQLCMVQSEHRKVNDTAVRDIHRSKLVIIDEAHLNRGATMESLLKKHREEDAAIVGYTATPLDLPGFYNRLVIAGTNSEGRACGALVPCMTYGPDEPDLKNIKRQASGEYKVGDVVKRIMTQQIFGRVFEWWKRLNPDAMPTLLFAPGVKESIWFAEQFHAQGVRVAHIDGTDVWIDGELHPTSQVLRDEILRQHHAGEIAMICNRFVLREGLNLPWCRHMIFATVMGGLQSYIQAGGRGLRAAPGKDHVILQDHGGNFWRHGSLNADRHWNLDDSNYVITELREDRLREHVEPDPIVCPKCRFVRRSGPKCPKCGHTHKQNGRLVVQIDGSLKMCEGPIMRKKARRETPDAQSLWESCYFRCKKAGMTFRQAEGLFVHEHQFWPKRDLQRMPLREIDWFRKIQDVPVSELR